MATSRPGTLPEEFLYDHWYVAAYGEEITQTPMRRVILDEPIVFYRTDDGTALALIDRCIHRAFPLSRGKCEGNEIVCGYHGFRFDPSGACTWVPAQETVPKAAHVRSFPVVESGPYVWIWMGEAKEADPALIPDHAWMSELDWSIFKGLATVGARYALLVDNLLDLSHETFLHDATIGTVDVAETPMTSEVEGTTVRMFRHMPGAEIPPTFRRATGITEGTLDRTQDALFDVPEFYTLRIRLAQAGAPEDQAHVNIIVFAMTPETRHSTHDFFLVGSRLSPTSDAPRGVQPGLAGPRKVLREDVAALEALEANLPAEDYWQEISINIDRAGLLWRRVMRDQLRRQDARRTPATG